MDKTKIVYCNTCETCGNEFESQFNLQLVLPRWFKIVCEKCTNKIVTHEAKRIVHNALDQFIDKILGN